MALTASSVWASFDRGTSLADTAVRDVSPLLFAALNSHPGSLAARIKKGDPVGNRKAEWVEQALNPDTVTLDGTNANVDGSASNATFAVTSGQQLRLKVGDLLKNKTQNIAEVMQVTVITSATDITVTRGYGMTDGSASHANGDVFEIIPAAQEGSAIGSDRTKARTTRYNYTQIFDTAVQISRTMMNTNMYNVSDEFANSVANRTIELKNRINYTMLNGVASAAASDSVYGSMMGIIPMILAAGDVTASAAATGTNIDSSTTSLTYDALSDLIGVCSIANGNRGGNYVVVTGQAQYENIATWPDGQIRRQYGTSGMTYGGTVDAVISKQGITASVMLEPDVPIGNLVVLDLNRIELCPLANSAMLMYVDDLGTAGNDYKQARLVAEWTLKMHNADLAHGIMNALT